MGSPADTAAASDAGIEPLPGRAVLALILAIVVGGALAWAVPLSAVVLIWPLLFFVPGWVVVRRVAPDLSAPGAVGVALVASTYGSAHLVNVVARVGGFGGGSIILSAIVLALVCVVFARVRHRWLAPLERPTVARIAASVRTDASAWIVAGAVGLVVAVVLAGNGWVRSPDGWVAGGWNWSDLLVHVAIGSSIAAGNFPPQVPYFAGEPLTYHWFADFHGAIVSSVASVDIIGVYFASSALFAGALALLIWALAARLTGSRRVAAIAAILGCLGGGMGWLRLVGDLTAGAGSVVDLVTNHPYDNTWADGWPYFKVASVLGTGLLPHRATTLGLPGLVAVVLLIVACVGRRPAGVLLAGILAALLAPFQFFAFPATYLIVGLYVLSTGAWRARTVGRDALLFLAPVGLAAPFILESVFRQRDSGAFRFVTGWGEARFEDGPAAVAFFYLTNLGIPFVLAIVAAIVSRRLPGRGFLVAWMVALFLVPNLVLASSVEFDMNKYFQIMWMAVAILAAWLIHRWPRTAIAAVLLVAALSPALVAVWHMRSPTVALSLSQETAARWIAGHTPLRTVFVTDAYINSPVDLGGRLRVSTFGPYVSNLGYDPAPREADIRAIYCDGPDVAVARMARYGATYVLSSGGLLDCAGHDPTDFETSGRFRTVFRDAAVAVWQLIVP